MLDTWTSPESNKSETERNSIEKAKKVCHILKGMSIEKKKVWHPLCFQSHMPSTMGTLDCLNENILLTAKSKYKKSCAKREIILHNRKYRKSWWIYTFLNGWSKALE